MAWRLALFLAWQLVGACIGWWQLGRSGALWGALLACWVWMCLDLWRAMRVLSWLRSSQIATSPSIRGMWGDAAERMRKLLRQSQTTADNNEQRLQEILAALQATPNGVVLLDGQGRIEWCNQTAASQFGIDMPRDVMQVIGNLIRDPDFNAYYASRDFSRDVVLVGRQGTLSHPIRISVHLHPYGDGRTLLLSRDVTAVEQAEAMRRDFVANVSHEMRTPLTVLMGFVETLQTLTLTDDERARYLSLMAQQASRMQSVVQDLLTLSRLEGSPLPGSGEWTPARWFMQRSEEEARALSELLCRGQAHGHALRFPSAIALESAGEIAGVAAELQSVFSNLVSNAVRYTPAGGCIAVDWLVNLDGTATFKVSDSGPGIAPEHLPRLTERFYRVDRSRSRETGGTGLGLAIVKHVLQRHGASLSIESELGKGSVFAVTFPVQRWRMAVSGGALAPGPTVR